MLYHGQCRYPECFSLPARKKVFCRSLVSVLIATVVIAFFVPCIGGDAGAGQTYVSPKGYTIQVPPGWLVASAETQDLLQSEVQDRFSNLRDVDFRKVDVMAFNGDRDDFAESINVVVQRGRAPVSESAIAEASSAIQNQYRSLGLSPRNFASRVAQYAGRDCFVFSYDVAFDGVDISQTQYVVPGSNVMYFVTCTSKFNDHAHYQPIFEQMMQSFAVTGSGLAFWQGLPWLMGALIGGGTGLAWGVIRFAFKRRPGSDDRGQAPLMEESRWPNC